MIERRPHRAPRPQAAKPAPVATYAQASGVTPEQVAAARAAVIDWLRELLAAPAKR